MRGPALRHQTEDLGNPIWKYQSAIKNIIGVNSNVMMAREIRAPTDRERRQSTITTSPRTISQMPSAIYGTTPLTIIHNSLNSLSPPPTLSQLYLYAVKAQAIPNAPARLLPHLNKLILASFKVISGWLLLAEFGPSYAKIAGKPTQTKRTFAERLSSPPSATKRTARG
jgi:hypothetical protein